MILSFEDGGTRKIGRAETGKRIGSHIHPGGIHLLFSQNSFCISNVNQSRNSEKDATQVIRINITMKMGSRGPRDASSTNCPEFGDQLNGRTHDPVPCAMKKKGP